MLRILHEEGFTIKSRELNRVRSTHRWLLRTPSAGTAASDKRKQGGGSGGGGGGAGTISDDVLDINEDGLNQNLLIHEEDIDGSGLVSHLAGERKRKMEAESAERWANKKRRRRTRQYAGMPADPPGPPRFPSETTLAESQEILALDKASYAALRRKFQGICELAGIVKKTLAGNEAWESAKQTLISETSHLQDVIWIDKSNLERKQLALDVICSDVTKRMRAGGDKGMLMADAKNILGLNPEESREVRSAFYKILNADGFTSKVALGIQRWQDLKQRWINESNMLHKALSRLDNSDSYEMKTRAIEALATDVMKRLRDDQTKRKDGRINPEKAPTAAMENSGYGDNTNSIEQVEGDTSSFATMLVPNQNHHGHPQRMLSDHLVDSPMGIQIPMGNELGESLLLDPNAQGGFMGSHQQFMPGSVSLSAGAPSFDATQATAFQTPVTNNTLIPIYLRQLGPGNVGPIGDLWIGFLAVPSPSIEELRHIAAQKIPGSTCVEVVGLVRVPGMGGQYIPLEIQDDDQLGAYLAQEGPPTFHVRLTSMYTA